MYGWQTSNWKLANAITQKKNEIGLHMKTENECIACAALQKCDLSPKCNHLLYKIAESTHSSFDDAILREFISHNNFVFLLLFSSGIFLFSRLVLFFFLILFLLVCRSYSVIFILSAEHSAYESRTHEWAIKVRMCGRWCWRRNHNSISSFHTSLASRFLIKKKKTQIRPNHNNGSLQ